MRIEAINNRMCRFGIKQNKKKDYPYPIINRNKNYEDIRNFSAFAMSLLILSNAIKIPKINSNKSKIENDDPKPTYSQVVEPVESKEPKIRTSKRTPILPIEPEIEIEPKIEPRDLGKEMVEFAKEFLDFTEEEIEEICDYDLPDGLWCAAFIKYVATEVLKDQLPLWYQECGYNKCEDILIAAKENNKDFKDISKAKTGDLVIFKTKRSDTGHIGMVIEINEDTMTTIEGNTKNEKVEIQTYNLEKSGGKITSFVRLVD